MANNLTKVTDENALEVLDEIHKAFHDIPFENSEFQNKAFVLAAQITPERAYRQLGLRLHTRLNALRKAKFDKLRSDITIEEKRYLISLADTSTFDKRRYELDIMEIEESAAFTNKLINDCITECNYLYAQFKKFPKYTREQFEAAEEAHFLERSKRQSLGITGPNESLFNIAHDYKELEKTVNLLQTASEADYLKITLDMANKIKVSGEDNK